MLIIPNYPCVCRICLVQASESSSILLDTTAEGATYNDLLDKVSLNHEKTDLDHFLPQKLCPSCREKLDEFGKFQAFVDTSQSFLKAWVQLQQRDSTEALENLLNSADFDKNLLHEMLLRLEIVDVNDDLSQVLLSDDEKPEFLEVKLEMAPDLEEDSLFNVDLQQELFICKDEDMASNEPENSEDGYNSNSESQDMQTTAKRGRNFETRKRKCVFKECGLITRGKMTQHKIEFHRAYCKICGLVFNTEAVAFRHVYTHQPKEQRLSCESCGSSFSSEVLLRQHWREFHGKELQNIECAYCGNLYENHEQMLAHRKEHKQCKFCPQKSDSYQLILLHMNRNHKANLIACQECPAAFLGSKDHERHMRKHRLGIKKNTVLFLFKGWSPAVCAHCDRTYYNEEYLLHHVTDDHEKVTEKPPPIIHRRTKQDLERMEYKFQCPQCDKRFRLKNTMAEHIQNKHSGRKSSICAQCGACFSSVSALNVHVECLHTKSFKYKCDSCDWRCHSVGDMSKHKRSHSNERPYKCTHAGCDKAYKTPSALSSHKMIHTGARPHACTFEGCSMTYTSNWMLKNHMRTHTLEEPFQCWYCERRFINTKKRRLHCQKDHVGKPYGRELMKLEHKQQVREKCESEMAVDQAE